MRNRREVLAATSAAAAAALSGCGTAGAGLPAVSADYFTYQPADRFWHVQLIEAGWLLALSVLLAAATVWLIRHRAT
jgi:hypothetical protein